MTAQHVPGVEVDGPAVPGVGTTEGGFAADGVDELPPAVDPVVVGYCDGGTWSAVFGLSYRDLLVRDLFGPQRIVRQDGRELRVQAGTMGVAGARNEIVRTFLDSTSAPWLWMVDTDMGFAADTVDHLVAVADPLERPVVGALCFALKRSPGGQMHAVRHRIQPTLYRYAETTGEVGFAPILDYPRDQLVPVGGTGAACLLMHRHALAAIRDRYGPAWFTPITHPTGDHGQPRSFSEDLSFCVRLAAVGVPLYVHTGIRTTHDKGGIFLDEETYDAQAQPRG